MSCHHYNYPNCGCQQTGNDCATFPVEGAILADNRYYSLAALPSVKLLGVGVGSNAQVFFKPTERGIVFVDANGVATATDSPALTLPILNPAVSNVFPVPEGFKSLMIGNGSNPQNWQMVVAPTAGDFMLQSQNGSWVLIDVGQIPGIESIGNSATFAAKLHILGLVQDEDDNWIARKLTVVHKRVVVGDIDGDGLAGYKALPTGDYLEHPKARFTTLEANTFVHTDGAGTALAGGLLQAVVTGVGAITDGLAVIYSPSQKAFYRAPAHVRSFTSNQTNSGGVTPTGTYAALPSGHGVSPSLAITYPNVRVTAVIGLGSDEQVNFALFRDGVQLHEYTIESSDNITLEYLDTGVTYANHVYDIRWKKDPGASSPTATVRYSSIIVTTLP